MWSRSSNKAEQCAAGSEYVEDTSVRNWGKIAGLTIGVLVVLGALAFLSLPFRYSGISHGPGPLPSVSCRAPILIGWAGAQRTPDPYSGGIEDTRYTCGGTARTRLVFVGGLAIVMVTVIGAALLVPKRRT
jgi:hypothetical protein